MKEQWHRVTARVVINTAKANLVAVRNERSLILSALQCAPYLDKLLREQIKEFYAAAVEQYEKEIEDLEQGQRKSTLGTAIPKGAGENNITHIVHKSGGVVNA